MRNYKHTKHSNGMQFGGHSVVQDFDGSFREVPVPWRDDVESHFVPQPLKGIAQKRGSREANPRGPVIPKGGSAGYKLPYTLNELPQPQVLFTLGLLNLNPAPSIVSR